METMMIDALVSAGNAGADDDENGSKLDATNHDGTTSDKEETLHRTSVALVPDAATVDTCKDEDEDEDEDDYICEEDEDQTRFSEAVKPDECDILMPMCSANSENYIENILCKADEALCVCSVTDNFENLVGIQVCDVDDDVKDDNDDDNATVIDSSFEDNDEEKMAENQAWEEISISAALIDSFTAHKKFSITCTSSNIISTLPTCTHGREVIHAEGQSVLVSTVTAFRDMVSNPFPANMPPTKAKSATESVSTTTKTSLGEDITNVAENIDDINTTSAAKHNKEETTRGVAGTCTTIDLEYVSTTLTSAGKEMTFEEMEKDFDIFNENIGSAGVSSAKNNDLHELIHMATTDHEVSTCKKVGSTKKRKAKKGGKAIILMKRFHLLPKNTSKIACEERS